MADLEDVFTGLIGREDITMRALECWYVRDFSKYGMIAVAHAHGKRFKVLQYLASLTSLLVKLQQKVQSVCDPDTKQDLLVMINRCDSLLGIALDQFNINLNEVKRIATEYGDEIMQALQNVVGQRQQNY